MNKPKNPGDTAAESERVRMEAEQARAEREKAPERLSELLKLIHEDENYHRKLTTEERYGTEFAFDLAKSRILELLSIEETRDLDGD